METRRVEFELESVSEGILFAKRFKVEQFRKKDEDKVTYVRVYVRKGMSREYKLLFEGNKDSLNLPAILKYESLKKFINLLMTNEKYKVTGEYEHYSMFRYLSDNVGYFNNGMSGYKLLEERYFTGTKNDDERVVGYNVYKTIDGTHIHVLYYKDTGEIIDEILLERTIIINKLKQIVPISIMEEAIIKNKKYDTTPIESKLPFDEAYIKHLTMLDEFITKYSINYENEELKDKVLDIVRQENTNYGKLDILDEDVDFHEYEFKDKGGITQRMIEVHVYDSYLFNSLYITENYDVYLKPSKHELEDRFHFNIIGEHMYSIIHNVKCDRLFTLVKRNKDDMNMYLINLSTRDYGVINNIPENMKDSIVYNLGSILEHVIPFVQQTQEVYNDLSTLHKSVDVNVLHKFIDKYIDDLDTKYELVKWTSTDRDGEAILDMIKSNL